MRVIEIDDFQSQYRQLVDTIWSEGEVISPRGHRTVEIANAAIVFPCPGAVTLPVGIGREYSTTFFAAEMLQILSGVSDLKQLDAATHGQMMQYSDDGITLQGAYGPRVALGLERVVQVLDRDNDSRQAVASVWGQLEAKSKDVPCTLSLAFAIRSGQLNMTVVMRSNDVWRGLPYDAPTFASIHEAMAIALRVSPGTYTHVAHSLHLYERDVPSVRKLADTASHSSSLPRIGEIELLNAREPVQRWRRITGMALEAVRGQMPTHSNARVMRRYAELIDQIPRGNRYCDRCRYWFVTDADFEQHVLAHLAA